MDNDTDIFWFDDDEDDNIVEIYEVEIEPGVVWTVYEYDDGEASVVDGIYHPVPDILISEYAETLTDKTGLHFE